MGFDTKVDFWGSYSHYRNPTPTYKDFVVALGALASLGWRTSIELRKNSREEATFMVSFTHDAWHGTLNNPRLKTIWCKATRDALPNLYKETIGLVDLVQILWTKYKDMVFEYDYTDKTYKEEQNSIERQHYLDVGLKKVHVVCPERMTPIYALPGFPGCPTLEEYLRNAGKSQETHDHSFMEKLLEISESFPMARGQMIRLKLQPSCYYDGKNPVAWRWRSNIFLHGIVVNGERRHMEAGSRETDEKTPYSLEDYSGERATEMLLRSQEKADILYQRYIR